MSDTVSRLNTSLEGRYSIEREGGMATVYLADDLKHERKVALRFVRDYLVSRSPPSGSRSDSGGLP